MAVRKWARKTVQAEPMVYHVRVQVSALYDYYVQSRNPDHAQVIAAYHAKLDVKNGKNLAVTTDIVGPS